MSHHIEEGKQRHHLQVFSDGRDPLLPPHHPINALSHWRKFLILVTLSYAGFLANFSVAIIQVAFPALGESFGVSPGMIPNSIGYNLLGFAVGPLFWNPLSKTIGRRPVYIIGSFLFMPMCVWMALSPSYPCFCVARTFAGLTSAWSQTVPAATIADIFVKQVRGSKISMYAVAVVVAPAVSPVFCGLIVNRYHWPVLFWLILGMAGLQFILFFFIVPETMWHEDEVNSDTSLEPSDKNCDMQSECNLPVKTGRIGPAFMPWHRPIEYLRICVAPILMLQYVTIVIPSIYYGMIFAWSVGITIVMPQKFGAPPYSFAEIPLGAAFLAFGIGGVLGKWSGGVVGDKTVLFFEKRKGVRQAEHRLYALLPILPFMLVGCIIVGVTVDDQLHWIAYLIGGGLFFFCLAATTGILQTYVLENYLPRSMDTQAVFVFWKSIWGFVVPFFVYEWGESHGFLKEYAVQGALSTGLGMLLCLGLIAKGHNIRKAQGMPIASAK